MNHFSDESLNEYLDGMLSLDAQKQLEAHLSDCSFCRDQISDLRQVTAALTGLGEENPKSDITSAVLARVKRRRIPLVLRLALAILAGGALGLLILFSRLGWQLLKTNNQLGVSILCKLNTTDLHFFQTTMHGGANNFVGVPLPGLSLGILVLVFALLLALGNFSLLKPRDR